MLKKCSLLANCISKNSKFYTNTYKGYNIFDLWKNKLNTFLGPKEINFNVIPSFKDLTDNDIKSYSGVNPEWTYKNSILWTPKFYIHKEISTEFLFELKKFRKLDIWEDSHQFALTQLILTEAIRDTSYEIEYNFAIKASLANPFHGMIDILMYNNDKSSNFYPVIPVIFPNVSKHHILKRYVETHLESQIVGTAYCLLKNYKLNFDNKDVEYVRAFQTNGHEWCLFEVHENYVKKTNFFTPKKLTKNPNHYPRFFDDYNHIQAVLGLIRFALSNHHFNIYLKKLDIEDNIVLKSSLYSLSEKSENILIKHKEAISMVKLDSPDIIDDIGVKDRLLEDNKNKGDDVKLVK